VIAGLFVPLALSESFARTRCTGTETSRGKRLKDTLTTWDIRAGMEASSLYAREDRLAPEPDIDLPKEHLRDSSGRTAGAERG
jgi:hypothetical protein